jgi:predicted nucleotidyltransferase component of viral defense system
MLERLLERISISEFKDRIILKGGMLIAALVGIDHRTTMDLDATLRGYPLSQETVRSAFTDICAIPAEDDVTFTLERVEPIRDADEYGGYRASVRAKYETILTPLKIDITTGDIITPDAVQFAFRSNFEDRCFAVWAYNSETILAEKVETILRRSVLNTRPRDFYDVYIMMKTQYSTVDQRIFQAALNATSERRGSRLALQNKEVILQTIWSDKIMRQRWEKYCKENYYAKGIEFDEVMEVLMNVGK